MTISPIRSVDYAKAYYTVDARQVNSGAMVHPVTPIQKTFQNQRSVEIELEGNQRTTEQVQYEETQSIPTLREGADPVEMAVRRRIVDFDTLYQEEPSNATMTEEAQLHGKMGQVKGELAQTEIGTEVPEEIGETGTVAHGECETCQNRQYVDGSNDGLVSYQTPTHISPEQSASKVMSHEQEHVVNEQLYAKQEGSEVVRQDVKLHGDVCPECGVSYTSGGKTTTVTQEEMPTATVTKEIEEEVKIGEHIDVFA